MNGHTNTLRKYLPDSDGTGWRAWLALPVLVAALAALLVLPAPVEADTGFTPRADRGEHYWCYDDRFPMAAAVSDRAEWTMNNVDGVEAQTVVNTQFLATCPESVDVRYQQVTTLAVGVFGRVLCNGFHDNGQCDRFDTRIDWANVQAVATNPNYQARKTLCHEVGHTLGAAHHNHADNPDGGIHGIQSCMLSGLADSGDAWTRVYGNHHRSVHINPYFS